MNLRSDQVATIEKNASMTFVHSVCDHLRAHHPSVLPSSDQQLELKVRVGVARAQLRGLKLQPKIAFYITLMFEIAPNFDDQPNIWRVLYRAGSEPDIQIDYLPALVGEKDWAAAKAGSGRQAWARVLGWA